MNPEAISLLNSVLMFSEALRAALLTSGEVGGRQRRDLYWSIAGLTGEAQQAPSQGSLPHPSTPASPQAGPLLHSSASFQAATVSNTSAFTLYTKRVKFTAGGPQASPLLPISVQDVSSSSGIFFILHNPHCPQFAYIFTHCFNWFIPRFPFIV